jgi:hypothetical protein
MRLMRRSRPAVAFLTRGDTSADPNCRVFGTNDQLGRPLETAGKPGRPWPAAPDRVLMHVHVRHSPLDAPQMFKGTPGHVP